MIKIYLKIPFIKGEAHTTLNIIVVGPDPFSMEWD
jgi:hypothetical protein